MNPGVALIATTALDLNTLLPLSREILGYSPAKSADGSPVPLSQIMHALTCVAAFKDEQAQPSTAATMPYLNLVCLGFLIAASERDMSEILEAASGMHFTVTDTLADDVKAALITGSIAQWRDAILSICSARDNCRRNARCAYNIVHRIMCQNGLAKVFDGVCPIDLPDRTYLLEYRK